MCGLVGFIVSSDHSSDFLNNNIKKMSKVISHRGPDSTGHFTDTRNGLAFGHNRLAIQDLSKAGDQPMQSPNKLYNIIFNGEIYNHLELRDRLVQDGVNCKWKGFSDTETILNCIENWGIPKTLENLNGMFALAIWDLQNKQLYLARDIIGEKPLYYGWGNNIFYFASELKSLKENKYFNNQIDQRAIKSLVEYSYIRSPYSVYKNIYKLLPGTFLKANLNIIKESHNDYPQINYEYKNFKISKYWSLKKVVNDRIIVSNDEKIIKDSFKNHFRNSVSSQLLADTSVGAFLSGGIDSSLVVAFMKEVSSKPFDTFTIGFKEKDFSEHLKAEELSKYLGIKNNQLFLKGSDMIDVIEKIPDIYDEPFADSSQLPTFLLSQFAVKNVKVALSGDGGDEMFGGYNRYFLINKIWKYLRFIPFYIRKKIAIIMLNCPENLIISFEKFLKIFFNKQKTIKNFPEKLNKLANRLYKVQNRDDFYFSLITEWNYKDILINKDLDDNYLLNFNKDYKENNQFSEKMMLWDSVTYLPDDILTKVDRASMAVSLETRAPFLSKDIINFAWSLPLNYKINNGSGKYILKEVLKDYSPKNFINYPKMGFGIPLSEWLRGPLKNWALDLLNNKKLLESNFFDNKVILSTLSEHLNGKANHHTKLWPILMFAQWHSKNY